jgi:RNA polymerase sigma-70 factor, ECF subfamily
VNDDPEEYRLARLARSGDREALAMLVERLRHELFAIAWYELHHYDDAQDVVAATLLHVCRHVGELRQPERVRAWIQRIARNEARQHRRRSPQRAPEGDLEQLPQPGGEELLPLRLDVERALRELPRDHSHAVALFHLAGRSIRDIARQTGRPEGTIRRWLCEGRRELAVKLACYELRRDSMKAGIVKSDLDPSLVRTIAERLKAAGYEEVMMLDAAPTLQWKRNGEVVQWHLPDPWSAVQLFVVPEWVNGRSALELLPLLKLPVGGTSRRICVLASPPVADSTLCAYWDAGVDAFFTLPLDLDNFRKLMAKVRESPGEPADISETAAA